MTSKFSGALVLTELNDFIAPSQACVKPVEGDGSASKGAGAAAMAIQVEADGSYVEVGRDGGTKKLKTAAVTLTDCLACSGCITSAESVLVEMQSHMEVYRALALPDVAVVVSLSRQTCASFAAKYGISPVQASNRIAAFLRSLGCEAVFDVAFARDIALLESQREFVRRFRSASSVPSSSSSVLPMLASACPGWICYAEKTHGSYILPYISTTKSPQQIMGVLVKQHFAAQLAKRPDQIFHVAIMPCYDKKLEASRSDFYDDVFRTRDVDCVITSGELEKMFVEKGVDVRTAPEGAMSALYTKVDEHGDLVGSEGSGAGGYLEHIFRYAAKELFGKTPDKLEYTVVRGTDHQELVLEENGTVLLRFATAYGFRNIQNFVRKIKTGKSPYHFVEIMACPSACVNGGGQLKPAADGADTDKALLARTDAAYRSLPPQRPEDNAAVAELYRSWLDGADSPRTLALLHTRYHHIPKTSGLTVQW